MPKKTRKQMRYGILIVMVLLIGMWTAPCYAASRTVGSIQGHPIYENNLLKGLEIDENDAPQNIPKKKSQTFPSKYDPREQNLVPAHVEDQGMTNTCWAFSTVAAMECNLIKNGYETENVNLSENHLAYFFYQRQTDPLGGTVEDENISQSGTWEQNGGTIQGTANFLTTWAGVVKDGKSTGEIYEAAALPDVDSYDTDYHVKDTYWYNYSVENVKKAISDHGAVVSGIYISEDYWNFDESAYYCPQQGGNHAVAIVGWDDTYSRDRFEAGYQPDEDGAWIVRNSYGEGDILGDGYLYVSYEDASLGEIVAYEMTASEEDYAYNYQYDGSANPAVTMSSDEEVKIANTFVVQGSADGYNEKLKAVSIETLSTNVQYQMEIYTGIAETGTPADGILETTQTGVLTDAGSQRIELDTPVVLIPGERYAVVFTVSGAGRDGSVQVAMDVSGDFEWIAFNAKAENFQSYGYEEGKWVDLNVSEQDANYNFGIKAYTDNTDQKTLLRLNRKSLTLYTGGTEELSAILTPKELNRNVVWISSDETVATVEDGTVKATGTGKATITAAVGSVKASCHVTVSQHGQQPAQTEPIGTTGHVIQTGDRDRTYLLVSAAVALCMLVLILGICVSAKKR